MIYLMEYIIFILRGYMPTTDTLKELPKMDAGMLKKADEFLADEKVISTRTGLRLLIEMMAEEFRALDSIIDNQNAQTKSILEQKKELEELKRKNIIMFVENNPKLAFMYVAGLFILSNFVPFTYLRKIVFTKLGIPDPLP